MASTIPCMYVMSKSLSCVLFYNFQLSARYFSISTAYLKLIIFPLQMWSSHHGIPDRQHHHLSKHARLKFLLKNKKVTIQRQDLNSAFSFLGCHQNPTKAEQSHWLPLNTADAQKETCCKDTTGQESLCRHYSPPPPQLYWGTITK